MICIFLVFQSPRIKSCYSSLQAEPCARVIMYNNPLFIVGVLAVQVYIASPIMRILQCYQLHSKDLLCRSNYRNATQRTGQMVHQPRSGTFGVKSGKV